VTLLTLALAIGASTANVPRAVLVVAHVGMAMALLVAGGLMVHSFVRRSPSIAGMTPSGC